MILFDIATIFPEMFESYFSSSILKLAQEKGCITIRIHNLRQWATDKHHTTDDEPFGGGAGMVMKIEPMYRAVKELRARQDDAKSFVVLFTPRGDMLTQERVAAFAAMAGNTTTAEKVAGNVQYILLCGRYEGVDQRVHSHIADYRISVGSYVLSGGELPAMIFVDAVSRLVPGVLGSDESLKKHLAIGGIPSTTIYPQFTRPATFVADNGEKWSVPAELLNGNHKEIAEWRKKNAFAIGH